MSKKKNPSKKAKEKGSGGDKKRRKPSKPHEVVDDDIPLGTPKNPRDVKGIGIANRKPSYCLKRGIGHPNPHRGRESIRSINRIRLRLLLKQLFLKRNWVEASGVLSVLLQGSSREKSISRIRKKYWATLELLHHIKGDNINKRKVQLVYDLRIKKLGPMKTQPTKERFATQREYILFCLKQGDKEDAHQAALCLMQERGFEDDSVSNLVVGLTYFQLWYSGIPREMELGDRSRSATPVQSVMSEGGIQSVDPIKSLTPLQSQISEGVMCMSIEGPDAVKSQGLKSPLQCDSSTSVGNEKDNSKVDDCIRKVPMDVDDNAHKETPRYRFKEDVSMISAESGEHEEPSSQLHNDEVPSTSIFYTHGLPPWLLPLQLPHSTEKLENFIYMHRNSLNDHYKDGLKYLRAALYLEPPAVEAFHPLIQMLLAGDRVEEALDEAKKFICNPCTVLQMRLKTGLLEHFNSSNNSKLSAHIEDILKRDPTCTRSVAKLVGMYLSGQYSAEKLVEMIGLHLDATYAQCDTWEVFASCLINLSECEGDRFSTCSGGDEDGQKKKYTYTKNHIPAIFSNPESLHTWKLRCRWWQNRHYSRKIIESEIAEGDLRLMTHKAAVACHLYGQEFRYVVQVSEHLGRGKTVDLLSTLRIHRHNSVGFYFNVGGKSV